MMYVAKVLEALGIAGMMIGLVEGIFSQTMWSELTLSIIGVVVFIAGRWMEKRILRKHPSPPTAIH
jgi:type III secretory pathway component EscS